MSSATARRLAISVVAFACGSTRAAHALQPRDVFVDGARRMGQEKLEAAAGDAILRSWHQVRSGIERARTARAQATADADLAYARVALRLSAARSANRAEGGGGAKRLASTVQLDQGGER